MSIIFIAGFAWGMWFSEIKIRREIGKLEQGRLWISMPMHKDETAQVLGAIKALVEQAKGE